MPKSRKTERRVSTPDERRALVARVRVLTSNGVTVGDALRRLKINEATYYRHAAWVANNAPIKLPTPNAKIVPVVTAAPVATSSGYTLRVVAEIPYRHGDTALAFLRERGKIIEANIIEPAASANGD